MWRSRQEFSHVNSAAGKEIDIYIGVCDWTQITLPSVLIDKQPKLWQGIRKKSIDHRDSSHALRVADSFHHRNKGMLRPVNE